MAESEQEGDWVQEAPPGGLPFPWGFRSTILLRGAPLRILQSHLPASRGPRLPPPTPPPPAVAVVTGSWLSPSPCQPRQPGAGDGGREPGSARLARLPGPLSRPLPPPQSRLRRRPPSESPPTSLCGQGVSVPEADRRRQQPLSHGHDSPAVAAPFAATARPLDRLASIFKP